MKIENLKKYILSLGVCGWISSLITMILSFQDLGIMMSYDTVLYSICGFIASVFISIFIMITDESGDKFDKKHILMGVISGISIIIASALGIWFNNLSI